MANPLSRYRVDGSRLTYARKDRGLKVPDLATLANLERHTIERLEAGGVFYYNTIRAVAVALKVKPETFELIPQDDRDAEPREYSGLRSLVESADVPMYFIDADFVIQHCNRPLETLVDTYREKLIGYHISTLLGVFLKRVPKKLRPAFLKAQSDLIKRAEAGGVQRLAETAVIDNSDLPDNPFQGPHRVEIFGQKIRSGGTGEHVASLVYYHVQAMALGTVSSSDTRSTHPLIETRSRVTDSTVGKKHQGRRGKKATGEELAGLLMPPLSERMGLARELLASFEARLRENQVRLAGEFEELVARVAGLVGEGSIEVENLEVVGKLNEIPKLFGASLAVRGTPVGIRYFKGAFEARGKDVGRNTLAVSKRLMALSVVPHGGKN